MRRPIFGCQDTVWVVVAEIHHVPHQHLGTGDSISGDQETPSSKRYSGKRPLRQHDGRSLSETGGSARSRPLNDRVLAISPSGEKKPSSVCISCGRSAECHCRWSVLPEGSELVMDVERDVLSLDLRNKSHLADFVHIQYK